MATAKKTATKKAPGKAMVSWDEELAKQAALASGMEASTSLGGNFISARGGVLSYKDANIPGNKMNVVVLDHMLENVYYEGRYDPENPSPPSCFAFGRDDNDMAPHELASDPQNDKCKTCPMNQWGSAEQGRGKACKNSRRLALITEGDLKDIENAEVAFLKLPVTSVKNWAGYVRQVADQFKRPPLGVLTEISVVPNAKTQFEIKFRLLGTIDGGDDIGALLDKKKSVQQQLFQPYQPRDEEEQPARKPARGKVGGKAPAKAAARGRR